MLGCYNTVVSVTYNEMGAHALLLLRLWLHMVANKAKIVNPPITAAITIPAADARL